VAKRIKELTTIPGLGSLFDVKNIPVIGAYLGGFQQIGKNAREANNSQFNTVGRPSPAEIAIQLKLLKGKKDELAILNKKNALENKNVEELKKKFDLERIGLTAALAKATDEETKLRIRSLLAILDNNDAMAKKILAEMDAAKSLQNLSSVTNLTIDYFNKLAQSLVGTANYLNMTFQQILDERLRESGNRSLGGGFVSSSGNNNFTPLDAAYFQNLATQLVGTPNYAGMNVSQIATERARESGNRFVDVNLRIDSPSGDRFAQLMAESIQVAGRSGYNTAPNGGLP
jgi:hypothetical protein